MPEPSSVIRWDQAVLVGASVDYLSLYCMIRAGVDKRKELYIVRWKGIDVIPN